MLYWSYEEGMEDLKDIKESKEEKVEKLEKVIHSFKFESILLLDDESKKQITMIKYSEEWGLLVASSAKGVAYAWNIQSTGHPGQKMDISCQEEGAEADEKNIISDIAFDQQGGYLLLSSYDEKVYVF